ncbi:MAG: SDR family oxidoreductase [Armatimonadetes bacterium]|nr:SDR family oxidoreductase [Armatimonadota bacterium]MDE2205190.1 SDR family oxidoreductase [Armatimonadota bacterium]
MRTVLLMGASQGIGRAVALRFAAHDCCILVGDRNAELAERLSDEVASVFGAGRAAWRLADCTNSLSAANFARAAIEEFGQADVLAHVAGIFIPPRPESARSNSADTLRTLEVNVAGALTMAEAARDVIVSTSGKGCMVLISSANAVVAKSGSIAYDTSKAAVSHLVRELAVSCAPHIRVNGVAPAGVVEGSGQFPRERLLSSLAKYAIPHHDSESTDKLATKLGDFYAERTLLKRSVPPDAVAEAVVALCSDGFGWTTGHVVPVDAGLPDAFLR